MSMKDIFTKITGRVLNGAGFQAKFQRAWDNHAAAFGPMLENAYAGDMEARTHLTAALNNLSRGETEAARGRLETLGKAIKTDADKAAWLFFTGLLLEKSGKLPEAVRLYAGANQIGHDFYLPYLKAARFIHGEGGFGMAADNYLRALECLKIFSGSTATEQLEASIHANLAGCLTYKRDLAAAEEHMALSVQAVDKMPGRDNIESVLAAALGDEVRVRRCIDRIEGAHAEIAPKIRDQTRAILDGKDPHFTCMPANYEKIPEFWDWFVRNETTVRNLLSNGDGKTPSRLMEQQMADVFTSAEQRLSFGLRAGKDGFTLLMCDNFSATRERILQEFADTWPRQLEPKWKFRPLHSPHEEDTSFAAQQA